MISLNTRQIHDTKCSRKPGFVTSRPVVSITHLLKVFVRLSNLDHIRGPEFVGVTFFVRRLVAKQILPCANTLNDMNSVRKWFDTCHKYLLEVKDETFNVKFCILKW